MNEKRWPMVRVANGLVVVLVVIAFSGRICLAGPELTLYDVDFNGPPHAVGMVPATGDGPYPRNTPTSALALFPVGTFEVVPSAGLLGNRPLRLTALDGTPSEPVLGGVNLLFDLSDPALSTRNRFIASVDVVIENISTSTGLGLLFDAPSIYSVAFRPDGTIRVVDATGVNQIVGMQSSARLFNVKMTFDRQAGEWFAAINGTPVFQGAVASTDLKSFRIGMTSGHPTITSSAFVDNILITVQIPEPSSFAIWLIALVGLVVSSRRRPSTPRLSLYE